MFYFDLRTTFEAAVEKLVEERSLAVEQLTKDQFVEALKQAIKSGDFQRLVSVDGRQAVTYIPFREVEALKSRVSELEEIVDASRDMALERDLRDLAPTLPLPKSGLEG